MATKKSEKKKTKKKITTGVVHIHTTFNNTIVTITDVNGNSIMGTSAGAMNFRGARKSTPYASQVVASTLIEEAMKMGLQSVDVLVKGPGFGRESAVRAIARSGVRINMIKDVSGVPHNGCRPRKVRHP